MTLPMICAEIVARAHGRATVTSDVMRQATRMQGLECFSAASRTPPAMPPQADTGSRPGTVPDRPLRVMIVEDEAIIAMELEFTLQDLGVEVVGIAMSAADAERIAEAKRPDLVTMDINIKGDRDGVSAATEIYKAFGIRSLFVSAYGNAEVRARASLAEPLGWISKPIDPRLLKQTLDEFKRQG